MFLRPFLGCLVVVLAITAGAMTARAVTRPALGELTVVVQNLHSDSGRVRIALWRGPDGFTEPESAISIRKVRPAERQAQVTFGALEPGRYALATYHDENDNGRLDLTWIGWPDEGLGFSNGAWISLGPPSFGAAAVEVTPGAQSIVIALRY